MRKLVTLIMVLTLVLVPLTAFAESEGGQTEGGSTVYTEEALHYTINNGSITITDYFGSDETVNVPPNIAQYPVNTIAAGAFTDNQYVRTINLPATITTVEEGAWNEGVTVNYAGTGGHADEGEVDIDEKLIGTVKLAKTAYVYTGKAIAPGLTVYDTEKAVLKKGTDYKVKYKNNTNVGLATVTVTGIGDYKNSSSISKTFKINPKSIKIKSVAAGSKCATIKWNKLTKKSELAQVTGFQFRYSTSSKFTNAKTATLKKNTYQSMKIKSLKSKKYYYFEMRTYKISNSKKYYSAWSSYKRVKIK